MPGSASSWALVAVLMSTRAPEGVAAALFELAACPPGRDIAGEMFKVAASSTNNSHAILVFIVRLLKSPDIPLAPETVAPRTKSRNQLLLARRVITGPNGVVFQHVLSAFCLAVIAASRFVVSAGAKVEPQHAAAIGGLSR